MYSATARASASPRCVKVRSSRPRNRLGRIPSTCPWRVRTIVVMYEAAALGRVRADEISENLLRDDRRVWLLPIDHAVLRAERQESSHRTPCPRDPSPSDP